MRVDWKYDSIPSYCACLTKCSSLKVFQSSLWYSDLPLLTWSTDANCMADTNWSILACWTEPSYLLPWMWETGFWTLFSDWMEARACVSAQTLYMHFWVFSLQFMLHLSVYSQASFAHLRSCSMLWACDEVIYQQTRFLFSLMAVDWDGQVIHIHWIQSISHWSLQAREYAFGENRRKLTFTISVSKVLAGGPTPKRIDWSTDWLIVSLLAGLLACLLHVLYDLSKE